MGYEGQPATFARLADEQLIRWMTLNQIALHPRDYPGIDEDITQEEFECRQKILDSLSYSEEQKQYTTALPLRGLDGPSTNEDAAYALQSKTWDRLLRQDPEFLKHYIKTFKDGYEWGYFVKVPKEDLAKKDGYYYLPTLPVKQPHKPDHLCRLTFMANHRSKNGKSINDCLHVGQDLLANLVLMVIKFRSAKFCFSLDLKRMFHQIALTPESQEFLRFFALVEKEGQIKMESWHAATLPFGLCCSPNLACFIMQQHAKKYENDPRLSSASAQIARHSYMDDLHILTSNESTLTEEVNKVNEILGSAHFTTWKFVSYSIKALFEFPEEKLSKKEQVSVLGTQWHPQRDEITFNFMCEEKGKVNGNATITKRSLLSNLAQIFDSLGLLSAFTVSCKITLQKSWTQKVGWDDPLEGQLLEEAKLFLSELPRLQDIRLPRCFLQTPESEIKEIAVTCDASIKAYSAMVFLITVDPDGTRRSHLAFAKTRVKPLNKHLKTLSKEMSVCRLELLAAVLAATIGVFIQSAFKEQLKVRYFTDSQITLYCLLNDPLTFRPWVSNRLHHTVSYWVSKRTKFRADAS